MNVNLPLSLLIGEIILNKIKYIVLSFYLELLITWLPVADSNHIDLPDTSMDIDKMLSYFTTAQIQAQLDAPSDWRPGSRGFNTRRGRQHSFVEIDHEIFSTVILSLPLIQEGQLSVSGPIGLTGP